MTDQSIIRMWAVICTGIFLTASSISWAVAASWIYSPVYPVMSAKEICAKYSDARSTPFCMEVAKQ